MSSPSKSAKVQPVEETKQGQNFAEGAEEEGDYRDRETTRAKIRICCEEPESTKYATVFHTVFSILIILSIVCYMTSSLNDGGYADPKNLSPATYNGIEICFSILFTIDLQRFLNFFTNVFYADSFYVANDIFAFFPAICNSFC